MKWDGEAGAAMSEEKNQQRRMPKADDSIVRLMREQELEQAAELECLCFSHPWSL